MSKDPKAVKDPKEPLYKDPKEPVQKDDDDDKPDPKNPNDPKDPKTKEVKDPKAPKDPKDPKGQDDDEDEEDDPDKAADDHKDDPSPAEAKVEEKKQQTKEPVRLVEPPVWKTYDFLYPGGRVAKLVKIEDIHTKQIPFNEILAKLKLNEGAPVVNLIGAKDTNRGKFYGGIARACFNTDAIIVDNATSTGIEKFAIRRGLKLIGVAPENDIKYPKLNPTYVDPNEITNGHTHLFLLNNQEKNMYWGSEATLKINLCKKLAEGKPLRNGQRQMHKIINILLGESDSFMSELQLAVLHNLPVLVIKGSPICNEYFANQQRINAVYSEPSFGPLVKKGHFYGLNSLDSEDVAQFVHFFLTVTPY